MRNRILALTRESIPYVKWLRPIAGSIAGCIVMQQLDFWFASRPNGYYKFLEACPGHPDYRKGDSWAEELNVTPDEFRTAFDKVGTRWRSKREFDKEEDKFLSKFYCSYHDKIRGVTWYFRNHDLLDAELEKLAAGQDDTSHLRNWQNPVTEEKPCQDDDSLDCNRQTPSTEMGKSCSVTGNLQLRSRKNPSTYLEIPSSNLTEITTKNPTEITSEITTTNTLMPEPSPVAPSESVVVFDKKSLSSNANAMVSVSDALPEPTKILIGTGRDNPAVAALVCQRVTHSTAQKLVQKHGERLVLDWIEALPHAKFDDAAAFLVKALSGDEPWALPSGYRRAKEDAEEREKQQQEEQKRAAMRRVMQERVEADCAALEAHWQTLPVDQQQKIMEQARAAVAAQPMGDRLLAGPIGAERVEAERLRLLTNPPREEEENNGEDA